MEKTHRSAIVTGASGGIGRAMARRLVHDGFMVVVHCAGNATKTADAIADIKGDGGRTVAVRADVAIVANVARLFPEAMDTFGAIGVVVRCAGIMPLGRIADGDMDVFDRVMATNLRGAFIVLGRAARQVSPGGRIIACSTSVIALALPAYGPLSRRRPALRDWSACSPMTCVAAISRSTPWPVSRADRTLPGREDRSGGRPDELTSPAGTPGPAG